MNIDAKEWKKAGGILRGVGTLKLEAVNDGEAELLRALFRILGGVPRATEDDVAYLELLASEARKRLPAPSGGT